MKGQCENEDVHTFVFPGLVSEVTVPSLGVGYEIGRAVAMKKPVLCLYRPQEGKRKVFLFFLFFFQVVL